MATSKTCLVLLVVVQLYYVAWSQEIVKRVPHGFVGMRGKKYLNSEEIERFYKRKPQFFVGVKGKKGYGSFDSSDAESLYYKRAPLGFVGMRGKKDYDALHEPDAYDYYPRSVGSLIGQIEYASNDGFKNDNEFLPDELTRYLNMLDAQTQNSESDEASMKEIQSDEYVTNEVDKRAANIHQFFGVRGKKSIQNKRPYDLTFRGKFIGVRGKKDGKNSGPQEIKFLLDQGMPWPKRKAQMGFFGMRGKKWTEESNANTEAPL